MFSRIRQAPTQVIELFPAPNPSFPPSIPVHIPDMGPGNVLDPRIPEPAKPLSDQEESEISNVLEAFAIIGSQDRISELITEMKAAELPENIREQLESWERKFNTITQGERAAAIGDFIFQVIYPMVKKEINSTLKDRLAQWECTCCHILQQILPEGENVELFLQRRSDERLFLEGQNRAFLLSTIQMDAIRSAMKSIETRMNRELSSLNELWISLQANRGVLCSTAITELESLGSEVELLRQKIKNTEKEVASLKEQDHENFKKIEAKLAECREVLRRLS